MPLAEVKAIVPDVSTQMQLRTSCDALAHVRDWGEEGDRYEARIEKPWHIYASKRKMCKTPSILICPDDS